jgi:hypothetical protein
MNPNISKELKKATEVLHEKMRVMQQEEERMMSLRTRFVNSKNEDEKTKLKVALIAQSKKLKAAEAEADAADKAFHRILSTEPEDLYDLLDHKILEHSVRLAVKKLVREAVQETAPVSVYSEVEKFFNSNKKKLENLADDNDWDEFYELAFEKFSDYDQDDVAQAMNKAAMRAGWFENEIEDYRQSEQELEDMAFGTKKQQKGINMADYDKKMKTPKPSDTDLMPIKLKSLKTESIKKKELVEVLEEAEYRGRKVTLNKPFYTPGGPRKRAVYVKNDKGNVIKVGFGDPNMRIKKSIPGRRKSFRARHKCDTAKDRTTARYWSCKAW